MTTTWTPRSEWVRDDRREELALAAVTPRLGAPAVEGELCDIAVSSWGERRRYCHKAAERLVLDADGRERLLCGEHVAKYFPLVSL